MENESKPGILIADIQFLIIEGLKVFLGEQFRITGCVCSKVELLKMLETHVPDILLLDYSLFDFDGYNDLKEIKAAYPQMGIIILGNHFTRNELVAYNNLGIKHILHKSLDKEELYNCLDALMKGKKYYSGFVLDLMLEPDIKKAISDDQIQLTASEIEIIKLIAEGLTNKEIATRKILSYHTITTHRKNILRKLGVSNASELIMIAIKRGLIDNIDYQI
jgi:DNA-binding NarL/FixJ family response regulator